MKTTLLLFVSAMAFAQIPEKDRAESFRLQRNLAKIEAQYQGMKSQYEAATKKMADEHADALKQLTAINAKLKSTCEAGGKALDEDALTCVEKPKEK